MATPKVRTLLTSAWVDIAGAAASVAGVTWQNIGPGSVQISFTTSSPAAGGATDAYHTLKTGEAFYDRNGSAHVWAMSQVAGSILCATAD